MHIQPRLLYLLTINILLVPDSSERARLLTRHQTLLAQHQVQDERWWRRRWRQFDAEHADAGEAVVRHHLQAAQSCCGPHCPGERYVLA